MVAILASPLAQTLEETGLRRQFDSELTHIAERRLESTRAFLRIIQELDTQDRQTWKAIVHAALEAGVTEGEIQTELGTSGSTLHRWKTEDIAPREGTRRLMKRALLSLIEEKIEALESELEKERRRHSRGRERTAAPAV